MGSKVDEELNSYASNNLLFNAEAILRYNFREIMTIFLLLLLSRVLYILSKVGKCADPLNCIGSHKASPFMLSK